jgi:hypothetical protein
VYLESQINVLELSFGLGSIEEGTSSGGMLRAPKSVAGPSGELI